MKSEETSFIIPTHEGEYISLSEKKLRIYYREKSKLFSKKNIIYFFVGFITLLILGYCILFFINRKNSQKGIENEDFRLAIFTREKSEKKITIYDMFEPPKKKKKKKKEKNKKNYEYGIYLDDDEKEILKDLLEKYQQRKKLKKKNLINKGEIEKNYKNNNDEKSANEYLNKNKELNIIGDDIKDYISKGNEESVIEKAKIKNIKDELLKKNKRKGKKIEKKDIFNDDGKNEILERQENKDAKIFDEKGKGINGKIKPLIHKKNLINEQPKKNNDDKIYKKDREIEDNNDDDKMKKNEV